MDIFEKEFGCQWFSWYWFVFIFIFLYFGQNFECINFDMRQTFVTFNQGNFHRQGISILLRYIFIALICFVMKNYFYSLLFFAARISLALCLCFERFVSLELQNWATKSIYANWCHISSYSLSKIFELLTRLHKTLRFTLSYQLEVETRKASPQVTNSKSKNKKINFELRTQSWKILI